MFSDVVVGHVVWNGLVPEPSTELAGLPHGRLLPVVVDGTETLPVDFHLSSLTS